MVRPRLLYSGKFALFIVQYVQRHSNTLDAPNEAGRKATLQRRRSRLTGNLIVWSICSLGDYLECLYCGLQSGTVMDARLLSQVVRELEGEDGLLTKLHQIDPVACQNIENIIYDVFWLDPESWIAEVKRWYSRMAERTLRNDGLPGQE
jgi:hypothetical protein